MKSIRSKLFLTYAVLSLVIILLLGVGLTWYVRSFYLQAVQGRLIEEAHLTGELLKPLLVGDISDAKREETDNYIEFLGEKMNARITLIMPDGVVLGDSAGNAKEMDNHFSRPEVREAREKGSGNSIRYSQTTRQEMLYTAVSLSNAGEHVGYLRLAIPLSQLYTVIWRIRYGLLVALFIVLLVTLGISFILSASLTRPLRQIAEVAENISQGDWQSRIYLRNQDEIGMLAASINKMAVSMQEKVSEITKHRDHLEAILATMVEGIIVFDHTGGAILVNPAAKQMLGLKSGTLFGKNSLEMVRNAELQSKIVQVSRENVYLEHELSMMFTDKKILKVNMVPIGAFTMNKSGVLAVFHDITRLRKLEEMRTDFAANVSHELRTPLTAIRGFAETLLDGAYKEPAAAYRFAGIIHREAIRLGALIEDVLTLAQIESGKAAITKAPVSIADVIKDVTERLSVRLEHHRLQLELPAVIPAVVGDRGLLMQALYNLMDNAIKYTHVGGTITIRVELLNEKIHVSVADNGIGIPAAARERIFERFYRVERARSRRQGGTGLGLAIVKHIVEAHDGSLQVESEEGAGTQVTIALPVITA